MKNTLIVTALFTVLFSANAFALVGSISSSGVTSQQLQQDTVLTATRTVNKCTRRECED